METEQLNHITEQLKLDIKMQNAAVKIQTNFRKYLVRSKFQKMIEKMNKCAKKIQMQWKVHRKRQFVNRIKNHVKIKSSIKI